jgi:hypothetical protein
MLFNSFVKEAPMLKAYILDLVNYAAFSQKIGTYTETKLTGMQYNHIASRICYIVS